MPLYEYSCQSCGSKFDAIRSMKDADAPVPCVHCNSHQTKRQLSVCYSHSSGGTSSNTSSGGGCGGCSGGSCGSCHH